MASFSEMAKATVTREFDLSHEWTLEEVQEKLNARAAAFQMPFELKRGIGGERISFETEKNLDVAFLRYLRRRRVFLYDRLYTGNGCIRIGGSFL